MVMPEEPEQNDKCTIAPTMHHTRSLTKSTYLNLDLLDIKTVYKHSALFLGSQRTWCTKKALCCTVL